MLAPRSISRRPRAHEDRRARGASSPRIVDKMVVVGAVVLLVLLVLDTEARAGDVEQGGGPGVGSGGRAARWITVGVDSKGYHLALDDSARRDLWNSPTVSLEAVLETARGNKVALLATRGANWGALQKLVGELRRAGISYRVETEVIRA